MSKVSVIICFYKRIKHLDCCLRSLAAAADCFDEVVVSDDGSPPEIVEQVKTLIQTQPFPVRYAWQPKNKFQVAGARNNGALHASGDYLIFWDCDFLLLPGTVEEHLKRRRKRRFVAGFFKRLGEEHTNALFQAEFDLGRAEALYELYPDDEIRKVDVRYRRRTLLMRWGWMSPKRQRLIGHVSLHREDFERVNGYDENFVGWGGEDEDFGIRLASAGIHCVSAIRAARVLHLWHPPELGGRHWSEGENVGYLQRETIPIRCENGYQERAALNDSPSSKKTA